MKQNAYVWKSAAVIRETEESVTIVFDTCGISFSYKPGQYVVVTLVIHGETVSRSYSLSSSPDEDEKPAITVKVVPDGRMSTYILQNAEEIHEWKVEGPLGLFHLEEAMHCEDLVLIAGGSGITPLFSILKYYLKHTSGRAVLFYCNRNLAHVIFRKALHYLQALFGERLCVYHFVSRQEEPVKFGENCFFQRLTAIQLKKLLKAWSPKEGTRYFLCGPYGLIELGERVLNTLNVPAVQVHKEYFFPFPTVHSTPRLPDGEQEVLFHFWEHTFLLEVPAGQTLLEAALHDRIKVPYSCKTGTCGQCAAKRLSGHVFMKSNYALNQELLDQGYVLLCQSFPLGSDVTIQIGEVH